MEDKDNEEFNFPDMDEVAYQVAIEAAVKMYRDLLKQGLHMDEAATIVAAIMTRGINYGKDHG